MYLLLHSQTYKFFTGVFSESTARALTFYASEYPEFASTARYVTFIGNLWKILSVKTSFKGSGLKLCEIYMFAGVTLLKQTLFHFIFCI